jgi:membrane-associated phospholipid phosphatase
MSAHYNLPFLAVLGAKLTLSNCLNASAGDAIKESGDILQFVLPATAASLTLANRDGVGALELTETVGATLGLTYALKYGVNERRPNGGNQSFPSAHTSISFSAAEFMRKRYGWEYGVPAYAAAAFVAYGRVESREHFPHDVLAGAGIGIISSYIFTKPYKGWTVSTAGDLKGFSVSISRNF